MKIKKFGFTLAEILITLTIIGIIAAILIPQMVDNTKKAQYGASLGRAVTQFEIGINSIIQKANNKLSETGSTSTELDILTTDDLQGISSIHDTNKILSNGFNLFTYGKIYFGANEVNEDSANIYYESTDTGFTYGSVRLYTLDKSNAYVMYAAQKTGTVDGIYTVVAFDVNGSAKPNKKGKDIFAFGLTTSGKLIPAGTKKMEKVITSDLGEIPAAETGCKDGEITNWWSCTARVVEDGFKINY